jgi:Recombination endonuclease VII
MGPKNHCSGINGREQDYVEKNHREKSTVNSAERAKDKRLRDVYKSSLEENNNKRAEQNNQCPICDKEFDVPPKFYRAFQDHYHGCCARKLGKYCGRCNRGILCFQCNKYVVGVLEKMKVDPKKIVAYFDKWTPILVAKGAYDEKPKPEKKAKLRRK